MQLDWADIETLFEHESAGANMDKAQLQALRYVEDLHGTIHGR